MLSPPTQRLVSFTRSLTDIPRKAFNQTASGHRVAQSSGHKKLTMTYSKHNSIMGVAKSFREYDEYNEM